MRRIKNVADGLWVCGVCKCAGGCGVARGLRGRLAHVGVGCRNGAMSKWVAVMQSGCEPGYDAQGMRAARVPNGLRASGLQASASGVTALRMRARRTRYGQSRTAYACGCVMDGRTCDCFDARVSYGVSRWSHDGLTRASHGSQVGSHARACGCRKMQVNRLRRRRVAGLFVSGFLCLLMRCSVAGCARTASSQGAFCCAGIWRDMMRTARRV